MSKAFVFASVALASLLTGCGNDDLSRPQAEQQIAASELLTRFKTEVPFQPSAPIKGERQGFWKKQDTYLIQRRPVFDTVISLTPYSTRLNKPLAQKVSVTGISDVPGTTNLKEVQYSWSYVDPPSVLKRFIARGGTGKAIFRKFDDGWRIEKLENNNVSSQGLELTEAELAEEAKDIATESSRLRIEAEEREKELQARRIIEAERARHLAEQQRKDDEARRIAKEKLDLRIAESKKPTKIIWKTEFRNNLGQTKQIIISDVDYQYSVPDFHYSDGRMMMERVWFGFLDGVKYNPNLPEVALTVRKGGMWQNTGLLDVATAQQAVEISNVVQRAVNAWRSKYSDFPLASFSLP